MPKVSVLLPVYNGAGTLTETLDSLVALDFDDFEVLVHDDASKDGSFQLLKSYLPLQSKMKLFRSEKTKGLAASLNFLAENASSDYLMRIDQDDTCLSNRMRLQSQFLDDHSDVAVVGGAAFHMGSLPERDHLIELPVDHESIFRTLRNYNCMYHPATMIRKASLLALGGYRAEFKNAEDYDLWLRMSRCYRLANLPVPVIRYRFSVSGMTLSRKWEQLLYVCLAQVSDEFPEKPLNELFDLAHERREKMGKKHFLGIVYRGTMEELSRLGFPLQMLKIARKMVVDVGFWDALNQTFKVLGMAIKHGD